MEMFAWIVILFQWWFYSFVYCYFTLEAPYIWHFDMNRVGANLIFNIKPDPSNHLQLVTEWDDSGFSIANTIHAQLIRIYTAWLES